MPDDALALRILECVESIPPGRVMSYGDVAEYVGASSPRIVGHVLAADDGTVPWHRVLRSNGTLAEHLYDEQRQRLLAEGVLFTGSKVRLAQYRWDGKPPGTAPAGRGVGAAQKGGSSGGGGRSRRRSRRSAGPGTGASTK